jgi:putative chitinase
MIPVRAEQIVGLAPHAHLIYRRALADIDQVLTKYAINLKPIRLAHFWAQVLHESGGLTLLEESLNYSVDGLLSTFGTKRVPRETAEQICRTSDRRANPVAIGNALYGGAWGRVNLGNIDAGDGWKYRGRGPIQITGRANYAHFGQVLGVDLVAKPDLVVDPRCAFAIPAAFWSEHGCNELADQNDLLGVSKKINGGTVGLNKRVAWLKKTKAVWP